MQRQVCRTPSPRSSPNVGARAAHSDGLLPLHPLSPSNPEQVLMTEADMVFAMLLQVSRFNQRLVCKLATVG